MRTVTPEGPAVLIDLPGLDSMVDFARRPVAGQWGAPGGGPGHVHNVGKAARVHVLGRGRAGIHHLGVVALAILEYAELPPAL